MQKQHHYNSKIFNSGKSPDGLMRALKEFFRNKRNGYSMIKNVSLLSMLFLTIFLWQCKEDDFKGEIKGVCPEVTVTDPANGALNVVTNKKITATFNENMDTSTINGTTFLIKQGTNLIAGKVTYSGNTATFTPANLLAANTVYTGTITTGAHDAAGNALRANFVWSFNTGVVPTVIATDPANGDADVVLSKIITATFSTQMDPLTINSTTVVIKQGATIIPGVVTYLGTIATFIPASYLAANTVYTGTITTGAKDIAGNALANNYTWSFATGSIPWVISTDPINGATGVAVNKIIKANFSKAMNPLTLTTATFTIKQGVTNVAGVVTYSGTTATFTPTSNLASNTVYTGTITTGAKDVAGNPLAADYTWSFTTAIAQYVVGLSSNPLSGGSTSGGGTFNSGASVTALAAPAAGYAFTNWTEGAVIASVNASYTFVLAGNRTLVANFTALPTGPPTVDLGCAAGFAILAGSTVTNTGNTIITGDLGLSPGSALTGFPPGVLIGTSSISNTTSDNAKLCLTSAFNDAAGRSLNVIVVSDGELGGKTLAPGLYKSAPGSFGITNSDLTLDAQGNVNAVWIFQMPSSTLTVGNGRKVILAGGAQANNIFWQVGSSATIGTTAVMKGTILADQSITLKTGATLDGRALTRIAAVTLDFNMVTKP